MNYKNKSALEYQDTYLYTLNAENEEKNMLKINFGLNLRRYMNEQKISIEDFAKAVGCDKQHIYGICSGKKAPSLFCLVRMQKYLNISADFLLGFGNNSINDKKTNEFDFKKNILMDKINSIEDVRIIEYAILNLDFAKEISKQSFYNKTN